MNISRILAVAVFMFLYSENASAQSVPFGDPSVFVSEQVARTMTPEVQVSATGSNANHEEVVFPTTNPMTQYNLKVSYDPMISSQKMLLLHKQAAKILSLAQIPPHEERINYFATLYDHSSPAVKGWRAIVSHVEPTKHGTIVTMRVYAHLDHYIDSAYSIESYLVQGKKITYIGMKQIDHFQRIIFR